MKQGIILKVFILEKFKFSFDNTICYQSTPLIILLYHNMTAHMSKMKFNTDWLLSIFPINHVYYFLEC